MQKIERTELTQSAHPLAGGAEKISNDGNTQAGNITIGDISNSGNSLVPNRTIPA
jgi:hypothetical protein